MENQSNLSIFDYRSYYLRAINRQLENQSLPGLKLVVGPTGLGKTSVIPEIIKEVREQPDGPRFIYTSHRHLLIGEMKDRLDENEIPCVYLKNDEDTVIAFLESQGKADFLRYLEQEKFFSYADITKFSIQNIIDSLKQDYDHIRSDSSFKNSLTYQNQVRFFGERCSSFLNHFKQGLMSSELPDKRREALLKSQQIWQLFPYIAFTHSPEKPVLLATIHKLLYGFFSGSRNERISSLDGNIIFVDEFDMQEKEILSFLCRSNEIRNSFEFVRLFYEEMSRQQQQGDLDEQPDEPELKAKAKFAASSIVTDLEKECQKEGFKFPQIRHFMLREDEFEQKPLSIFQSSVQIVPKPFYIKEHRTRWEIVKNASEETLLAQRLLSIINRTTDSILNFFSGVWADGLKPEWEAWVEQCYDQKNDNSAGRYQKIITEYGFYRRPTRIRKDQSEADLSNSIYFIGFNLLRLLRRADHTVPNEVNIEQKRMSITPEYILWRMCKSNLVFALSATGDIKRYINAFDLKWLENSCNYLPIDEEDKALVSELKRQKEAKRNYEVNFDVAMPLSSSHALHTALSNLEADGFFRKEEEEKSPEISISHRKEVLSLFLETLIWITQKSQNQAHLVFLNSFAFIEKLFQKEENHVSPSFYEAIKANFAVTSESSKLKREYKAFIDGKEYQLVFLDASKGREMEDESFVQDQIGVPLIVVTTYSTASNGVNLKWIQETDDKRNQTKRDFQGIHLLEAPHFYFSGNEMPDDQEDPVKMYIWKIWKLYHNLQISEKQFIKCLQDIDYAYTNRLYKTTSDFLLNQIAVFYQALGRVDRNWQEMPKMDIRLEGASFNPSVLEIFERYLTAGGEIAQARIDREAYTSSLILALHQQIIKRNGRMKVRNSLTAEDITPIETRCKRKLDDVLNMIDNMRKGAYSEEDSRKIIYLWWHIREAMLKQDYLFEESIEVYNIPQSKKEKITIHFMSDFVHQTAFLKKGSLLYFNRLDNTFVPNQTEETIHYDLNQFYRNFADNTTIARYFHFHNYRLRYAEVSPAVIFTPYATQSILAGAVGEAALKALLEEAHIPLIPDDDYSPALFEVSDLQVKGFPLYLDAKNFSWTTLNRFAAEPGDPEYDEKLNSRAFLLAAQKKWRYIVDCIGDTRTKLVFINLLANEDHPNEGWDENLTPIRPFSFSQSSIMIIQGVINRNTTNDLRNDFISWVNHISPLTKS